MLFLHIGFHNDIQTYEISTLLLFRKFKQWICIIINIEPYIDNTIINYEISSIQK
ncbi:protein of unknown function [Clostridium beijerinckii]|nr:protein of unknown function [Clostridium beijerinckii]